MRYTTGFLYLSVSLYVYAWLLVEVYLAVSLLLVIYFAPMDSLPLFIATAQVRSGIDYILILLLCVKIEYNWVRLTPRNLGVKPGCIPPSIHYRNRIICIYLYSKVRKAKKK